MKIHRITALMARHLYLYRRSLPRTLEVFYWPFLDLTIWGFITVYLARHQTHVPSFVTFLLGALILWDVLFRSQQAIALAFLEDLWARNLINLFASPLNPGEFLTATMGLSILKVVAVSVVMTVCALLFYSYNIFVMGMWLIPFVMNLVVMGWIIGVFATALIMRFGQESAILAWSLVFLFQPISCVFYPIDVLPSWLQPVAWMNPASHIFEGMRAVMTTGTSPLAHLGWAVALNALLLAASVVWFYRTIAYCKAQGLLVRMGE